MFSDASIPQWSQAIFELRHRLGLSQSAFGARLHYSAMAVSRWETGKQEPTSRCLIQLGNLAGQPDCWTFWSRAGLRSSVLRHALPGARSPEHMTALDGFEIVRAGPDAKKKRPKDAPKVRLVAVPLLNAAAGTMGQSATPFFDLDNATSDDVIATPAFWCPHPEETQCLRVEGTSMSPLINDGDIVAVDRSHTDPDQLNQKIVVAGHRDLGLFLARFVSADGVQLLESENHEHSPVTVEKDRKWQIIGKVLWWIRKGP